MVQLSKIVQLGGVPHDTPILGNNFQSAAKKEQFQLEIYGKNIYIYQQIDRFNKEYTTGSEITLTNNKIKDIIKVIKPLMTVDLALIKNALTQLTKNVLSPLELTSAASITDAATQKKNFGSGTLFNSLK